jgi:transketolase
MMSIAAGLASSGKTVFASTFAAFATGRVYDQIRQSIAYPNLSVKIIATHGGITVGGDGATHQMIEDIALMRALPNMRVIVPMDAPETYDAIMEITKKRIGGPFYLRMGRMNVPTLPRPRGYKFEVGKASTLVKGNDVTLIGTGIMVSRCMLARKILLEKHNIEARVVNMSTLKPIDQKTVKSASNQTGGIVTVEEHTVLGGLGSAVSNVISENCPAPMKMIGIPDVFGESGEPLELMRRFGLTPENIANTAVSLVTKR